MKRWIALALVSLGGVTGCRDLVFDAHRFDDDHVLAGRSSANGGPTLTSTERDQGWFVARNSGLSVLENDLRTRLDLKLGLKSTLRAYASGQTWVRDPRVSPALLGNGASTLASPVVAPIGIAEILRQEDANPGELSRLCDHPLLGDYIGASCDGISGLDSLKDVPMNELGFDVDAANIEVEWDQPRQVVIVQRPTDEAGSCEQTDTGLKFKCSGGFVCPRNAGVEVAGTCVWSRPCTTNTQCTDTECATSSWGICRAESGATSGFCNSVTNQCNTFLELDLPASDESPTAPVVRVRVPMSLSLDLNDALDILLLVNLKELVVDFRLQPNVCTGAECRTHSRVAFDNYLPPRDAVFSRAGVDVRARSRTASYDYEIIPWPMCSLPLSEFIIAPFVPLPPALETIACLWVAIDYLPPLIEKALPNAGNSLGKLVDTLLSPSKIAVPIDSLPEWFRLDASRIHWLTGDGRTLAIGAANGGWTDGTIDILANGATFSHILVNLEGTPIDAYCSGPMGGSGNCVDLCGGRPGPCSLARAKICFQFDGAADCTGGLALDELGFRFLMAAARDPGTGEPTEEQIDAAVEQIQKATAPIPAVPELATLLDASPLIAHSLQSVFTRPLEDAFGEAGEYTSILHCPATGTRPALCPPDVDGPVFRFIVDGDHDGIPDTEDACPTNADVDNVNTDGDTWCDAADLCDWTPSIHNLESACDCDVDGDSCNNELHGTPIPGAPKSVPSHCEPGPLGTFDEQPNTHDGGRNIDHDSGTDDCDPDDDGDGDLDVHDNCPRVFNPHQEDDNHDGAGNLCDPLCPGGGAPCIIPELVDPSLLPMGVFDFDLGLSLIPGCIADGPGCWGSFHLACLGAGSPQGCDEGGEIFRSVGAHAAHQLVTSFQSPLGAVTLLGDVNHDSFPDLLLTAAKGLYAIDGATGDTLWHVATTLVQSSPIAVGASFIAVGLPGYGKKGSPGGAVQLLSFDGQTLGAPILGPEPGGRFGASLAWTGKMLLVGAPGNDNGKLYMVSTWNDQPMLVLDGKHLNAQIGAAPAVAMQYGDKDVLALPAGGTLLLVERLAGGFAKLGGVVESIETGGSALDLSTLADFDGDGVREVAVGVSGLPKSEGSIGFIGEDGSLRTIGLVTSGGFGERVVALGDLDGDGAAELGVTLSGTKYPGAASAGSFAVLKRVAKDPFDPPKKK